MLDWDGHAGSGWDVWLSMLVVMAAFWALAVLGIMAIFHGSHRQDAAAGREPVLGARHGETDMIVREVKEGRPPLESRDTRFNRSRGRAG